LGITAGSREEPGRKGPLQEMIMMMMIIIIIIIPAKHKGKARK